MQGRPGVSLRRGSFETSGDVVLPATTLASIHSYPSVEFHDIHYSPHAVATLRTQMRAQAWNPVAGIGWEISRASAHLNTPSYHPSHIPYLSISLYPPDLIAIPQPVATPESVSPHTLSSNSHPSPWFQVTPTQILIPNPQALTLSLFLSPSVPLLLNHVTSNARYRRACRRSMLHGISGTRSIPRTSLNLCNKRVITYVLTSQIHISCASFIFIYF